MQISSFHLDFFLEFHFQFVFVWFLVLLSQFRFVSVGALCIVYVWFGVYDNVFGSIRFALS